MQGIYDPTRVITLAGPCIKKPSHFRVNTGAKISTITNGRMIDNEKRIISGDVLTGRVSSDDDFLSFYDYSISVISDEVKREFIGMLNPGSSSSRYSLTPVFLSLSKILFHLIHRRMEVTEPLCQSMLGRGSSNGYSPK